MKSTILLLLIAFTFVGCSRYDYYWHEEEDDVYFISQTPEEVDIYASSNDRDNDDDDYDTYDEPRSREYEPNPPRRRNDGTIYYPNRTRRTTTTRPRTNSGSSNPKVNTPKPPRTQPAPRRPSRPTAPKGGQPQ